VFDPELSGGLADSSSDGGAAVSYRHRGADAPIHGVGLEPGPATPPRSERAKAYKGYLEQ
jgi:hypothetical protein